MSDAAPSARDFLGASADEELIFDEAPPLETAAPVAIKTAEPRRIPRRARKPAGEIASSEPVSVPSLPPPSAGGYPAPAEEPTSAPAPFPPLDAAPVGSKYQPLLLGIVGLALLTSTLSLGGLIAVGRTLSHAETDRGQVVAERQALAGIPALVAHLDAASAKLDATVGRIAPGVPAVPLMATTDRLATGITLADLHREIDALKLSLGKHQPEGLSSLNSVMAGGFSEMTTRLDRLTVQLEQMEQRRGTMSGNRKPAFHAADTGRPS